MRIPDIKTYNDGRKPIKELYSSFMELQKGGWILDVIAMSSSVYMGKKVSLPIIALKTPHHKKKALWIISGIHGEEPAGPNAISEPESIESLIQLGKKKPIVLLPLCNPLGYLRNWRYLNQERWSLDSEGKSVGDSEHYLLDIIKSGLSRRENPSSREAEMLTEYIIKTSKTYNPLMSFDFHEDDLLSKGYVYSQGKFGCNDDVAKKTVKILLALGIPIQKSGKTRFGEKILNGIIGNVKDGSIDELLAAEKIMVNNKIAYKPAAETSLVIETPAKAMSLGQRVYAHLKIITSLNDLI